MVSDFLDELHQNLDATPGIAASGSSVGLPYQSLMWRKYLTLEHRQPPTLSDIPIIDLSISTPGYLRTMDIPLLEGRALTESDDAENAFVALVNETFANTHLHDETVVGKRLRLAAPDHLLPPEQLGLNPWYTIVGVVGDVRRWSLSADPLPEVYITQRQDLDGAHGFFVVVHTMLPTEATADAMRQAVWDIDSELAVTWVQPIDEMFSNAVAQPRFNVTLVTIFGFTALVLALIGVYGLLANMVGCRTREIGVRIALGARPNQILRHIAGQGIATAGIGIVIGIAISAGAARVLEALLFGVPPLDLTTFSAVVSIVLLVAVLAAALPSWRAAKLSAIEALGVE
jgi:predicted permease